MRKYQEEALHLALASQKHRNLSIEFDPEVDADGKIVGASVSNEELARVRHVMEEQAMEVRKETRSQSGGNRAERRAAKGWGPAPHAPNYRAGHKGGRLADKDGKRWQ